MIDGPAGGILLESDSGSSIGLGIAINEESGLLSSCEAGCEVNCGCGLTYPTLLVSNSDDPGQDVLPNAEKLADPPARRKMFHVEHGVSCRNSVGSGCSTWNSSRSNSRESAKRSRSRLEASLAILFRSTWNVVQLIATDMTHSPTWTFNIRGVDSETIGIGARQMKKMFHVERGEREIT